MKVWRYLSSGAGFLAAAGAGLCGCASAPDRQDLETAPYKDVVVFEWTGEERPAGEGEAPSEQQKTSPGPSNTAPSPDARQRIEEEILSGLGNNRVFSEVVRSDRAAMNDVALAERADLLVLLRIGAIANWESDRVRIVPELAALDTVLWFGTAIGGWWVPDREFETSSDVEVTWKRADLEPRPPAGSSPPSSASMSGQFRFGERLAGGVYRLAFWDRAKLWTRPWIYLMNIIVPAAFIPLQDDAEVTHAITAAALEDLKRQLAQKLRAAHLRAGGAPYLFQLEEPANGALVKGPSARLRFGYRLEPGFDEHEFTGFSALRIELRSGGSQEYVTVREKRDEAMRDVNERLRTRTLFEEQIEGLTPGLNLVRFVARTEIGGLWVTNTIVLERS